MTTTNECPICANSGTAFGKPCTHGSAIEQAIDDVVSEFQLAKPEHAPGLVQSIAGLNDSQPQAGAAGASEAKPWRERHAESIGIQPPMHYADAEIADLRAQLAHQRQDSKLTDLSKQLRNIAKGVGNGDYLQVRPQMLYAAADEIERYYGGMLVWKRTAEAKDSEFEASLAEARQRHGHAVGAADGFGPTKDGCCGVTVTQRCDDCPYSTHAPQADEVKEAARYRWLRDKSEPGICAFYLSVGQAFKGVKFARETVDAAIDDAMQRATAADNQKGGAA